MSVVHDIRLAFRVLRRNSSSTAIAIVSIALSVAATAVVFTAIKAVLITPLPYTHPEELVQIGTRFDNDSVQPIVDWAFWNDAQEIARRTRTLGSVAVYSNAIFDLAGDGSAPPEALYGLKVSENLFPTLGVRPMLGRNVLPEEDQPEHANEMILSYGLWVRRFNADRGIIGHNVQVDGHDCLVIGVMPPQFNFPLRRAAAHTPSPYVEFWTPIRRQPISPDGAIGIVARLRKGVLLHDAQEDISTIGTALAHEFPATNRDRSLRLGLMRDRMLGSAAKSLWLLFGAACVFLLIGCANVTNLLLARGTTRQREIAIRFAVGASKREIIRQLLIESCVMALLGGISGYVLTVIAWKALPVLSPVDIPRLAAARADWHVFVFALAIAVVNGILFGMAPALRATVSSPNTIRESRSDLMAGKRNRLRSLLVVFEVALAISLVVIGAEFAGGFIELLRTDPGFDADHLIASVILSPNEGHVTHQRWGLTYARFLSAVRAIPGVTGVGTVNALPFSGENDGAFLAVADPRIHQPKSQLVAEVDTVNADYLPTIGVRLLKGRWFTSEDMKESSTAAIVSDAAAKDLWAGQNPIGQRLCVNCTPEKPNNWKQVVGVVSNVRHRSMDGPPPGSVYLAAGALEQAVFLVARTDRPVAGLERAIRRAIASVDPNQPVFLSASMRDFINDSIADRRFIMALLAATALLALLMAAAGVYGVVAYTTSRRTQEIGLRIALGASRGEVHFLVFRQGFSSVIVGLAAGVGLTLALLRMLQGVIPGWASSATMFGIAIGLVSIAAAAACWLPARRATKVDPMVALRYE